MLSLLLIGCLIVAFQTSEVGLSRLSGELILHYSKGKSSRLPQGPDRAQSCRNTNPLMHHPVVSLTTLISATI